MSARPHNADTRLTAVSRSGAIALAVIGGIGPAALGVLTAAGNHYAQKVWFMAAAIAALFAFMGFALFIAGKQVAHAFREGHVVEVEATITRYSPPSDGPAQLWLTFDADDGASRTGRVIVQGYSGPTHEGATIVAQCDATYRYVIPDWALFTHANPSAVTAA